MLPLLLAALLGPGAAAASAQLIQGWDTRQFTFERIDADRIRLMREVEVNGVGSNQGQQIFADELEWNTATGEFSAIGNVLLASPAARLSAERVVFNTKTGLGTFYSASGFASLGNRGAVDKSMFGTLEPDIMFWGETIEKTGEDRYRITKGGFTTCGQPTPRWDVITGSATINLEDYAVLRNAVVRVKDVPVFYLPILYYPIQGDDRATGFLLPTYGRSTYRGQSLSNAFFWAINRSQDMTLFHDWYTKTGQGVGSEYRYVAAPGSEGQLRAYWLSQKEAEFEQPGGGSTITPAGRSYEISGTLAQVLPAGLRARGQVDYFSSLTSQQLNYTDIYQASRRQRTFGGSVTGAWGGVSVTGNVRRSELFTSDTDSIVNGYAPSITTNLSSKRLGRLPFYVSVMSDASRVIYTDRRGTVERDLGIGRFDATPTFRAALSNWPFLNVNGSISYRHTYFSESLDPTGLQVPVSLTRRYFDLKADVVGPIFSKVFTPNNALADRLKHVIEPNVSFQRITDFENLSRVVTAASSYDFVIGGVTRVNYGLTNRILVRKAPADPAAASASSAPRELMSVGITQTYYTDALASQFDTSYQSSYNTLRTPSRFSPVAVTMRTAPTAFTAGTLRMEYDHEEGSLRSFSATGNSTYRSAQVAVGWSTRRYSDTFRENALNASTTLSLLDGRTGGTYVLNWDIGRGYLIQQRWVGFYNAQCCGLAIEYQEYNFPSGSSRFPIPKDRRFNMSFTLAGIGTFSNFFGAFGGGRY
jgi:LPS-assembly protein